MFNPWYVRAAIEANTGVHLTLDQTVQYCFEEGLISRDEAKAWDGDFPDYQQFYDDASTNCYSWDPTDQNEGLPETSHSLED